MNQSLRDELQGLRARLEPHRRSVRVRIWGQLARLGGVHDFGRRFWITLDPVIYYPLDVDPESPAHETTIRHELVHIRQQRQRGLTPWLIKYVGSARFRYEQERDAFLVDVRAGADPRAIAVSLARDYKLRAISVDQMAAWLGSKR